MYFTWIKMKPLSKHASKLCWSGTEGNCVKRLCETEPKWIVQDVTNGR